MDKGSAGPTRSGRKFAAGFEMMKIGWDEIPSDSENFGSSLTL